MSVITNEGIILMSSTTRGDTVLMLLVKENKATLNAVQNHIVEDNVWYKEE